MSMRDVEIVEWALRERVKELTCLYGIARVMQEPGGTLESCITKILELLPPAWQFSDRTCARIVLDGHEFRTKLYRAPTRCQSAGLIVTGAKRGLVEVGYFGKFDTENPFLTEEVSLIEMVAREVSIMIERHESEQNKLKLQEQLRHADRLATIGQLAAGVAHELNEPLANILGFAQLAKKEPKLPKQTGEDMEKIVRNCLHAREVIHQLLTFARQMPLERARISLDQVVTDGLYFLESRCLKAGIEVVRKLDPEVPEIFADASQLNQVLVNIVVNAIQAMPGGGAVTIETRPGPRDASALLIVSDTGTGMSEAVRANIFTPFFTTKDVNEGTGLGLAVVHGIVASHGGTICVQSEPGKGARFEVELPMGSEERE
ncbi:MAG: ATP-binding protein [Candidatus Korobacteraceae bacterium]|jgi:signal transduction histidine kinase